MRYQWRCLPFGLNLAPSYFHYFLTTLFSDLPQVYVYVDDILIAAHTEESHHALLRTVLLRLKEQGLIIKDEKSRLCTPTIQFLGHQLSHHSIRPLESYRLKLSALQRPTTVRQTQRWLGALNWVRPFIKDASRILAPIFSLLQSKSSKVAWTPACERAYTAVMRQLEDCPTLAPVDPDSQLYLESDASDNGCGAVLWQQSPRGAKSIIGYFSKAWETKQSAGEIEMRGILLAMRHFRALVGSRHVRVLTDHRPLEGDIGAKTKCDLPKRLRWLEELQHYNLSIKYQRGINNPMADWLSRDCVQAAPLPLLPLEVAGSQMVADMQQVPNVCADVSCVSPFWGAPLSSAAVTVIANVSRGHSPPAIAHSYRSCLHKRTSHDGAKTESTGGSHQEPFPTLLTQAKPCDQHQTM